MSTYSCRSIRWSIPVHTGKPFGHSRHRNKVGVYPRTHGETLSANFMVSFKKGLSPYTRGNRLLIDHMRNWMGSIPVHTGKPFEHLFLSVDQVVYPRTHGETRCKRRPIKFGRGLSPYTRGNLRQCQAEMIRDRSIPVHTGKPQPWPLPIRPARVYPRTHGETIVGQPITISIYGLSPYTRGNRHGRGQRAVHIWSIPVHTGKPLSATCNRRISHVYPRTHGETMVCRISLMAPPGLSPYTRGNLYKRILLLTP